MTKASQEKLPLDQEGRETVIKWALWCAGFCGEQSAERGPVMLKIFELVEAARAEAFEEIVAYCGHPDAAEACRIILAKAKAARALPDTADPSDDYDCDHVWHDNVCSFCGRIKK